MRILLVEDDMMLGDGMVDALRSSGYTVDWLQQGLPALSALKSEEFAALNELDLATLHSRAEAEKRLEARVPEWAMRKFLVVIGTSSTNVYSKGRFRCPSGSSRFL